MNTCNECARLKLELEEAYQVIAKQKLDIQKLTRTSALTGLKNNAALNEDVAKAISAQSRTNDYTAIFFLDLDNFKHINDTYTHEFGDKCIKAVAKSLEKAMRTSDTVYHRSGDEFVILASYNLFGSLPVIKKKISNAVESIRIDFHGEAVALKASIGTAIIQKNDSITQMLERAEKSLQANKKERLDAGLRTKRS